MMLSVTDHKIYWRNVEDRHFEDISLEQRYNVNGVDRKNKKESLFMRQKKAQFMVQRRNLFFFYVALHNVSSQNSLQKDVLETKVIKRGPQKPMQLLHAFWDMLNGLTYTKLGNQHLIDFLRQKGWENALEKTPCTLPKLV